MANFRTNLRDKQRPRLLDEKQSLSERNRTWRKLIEKPKVRKTNPYDADFVFRIVKSRYYASNIYVTKNGIGTKAGNIA